MTFNFGIRIAAFGFLGGEVDRSFFAFGDGVTGEEDVQSFEGNKLACSF